MQHKGFGDTFFVFSEKLKRLKVCDEIKSNMKIGDELQRLYKMGVRHEGTPPHQPIDALRGELGVQTFG